VLSSSDAGFVRTITPNHYYPFFRSAWERRGRRPYAWYIKLEQLFGAHDFISGDPEQSLKSLLANRRRHPVLQRIYKQAEASDIIVIDGDGDIVFSNPPRRQTLFILAMIELGLHLRKPVCLVNCMVSDCPTSGRNDQTLNAARRLFSKCHLVSLRDPESLRYVRAEMRDANAAYVPDSLFAWCSEALAGPSRELGDLPGFSESAGQAHKLDLTRPYICIGGGALAASHPDLARTSYGKLVDAMQRLECNVYVTENDTPDMYLRSVAKEKGITVVPADAPIRTCASLLAHARLFLSGRYHPSIMASLGGTPCIFLGSHAHKMGSLAGLLQYDERKEFCAIPDDAEIEHIVSFARNYLQQGESLRARIREVSASLCAQVAGLPQLIANSTIH
jgi:polysaccharide pyruvyl transferase WcaK-like protein